MIIEPLLPEVKRLAIFMSGSGTNAMRIIERYIHDKKDGNVSFEPALVFTDNPKSKARHIAEEKYKEQGFTCEYIWKPLEDKTKGARRAYDEKQRGMLTTRGIDFIALAGYDWVVTSAICDNFVVANVHPGDLRKVDAAGKKAYRGLGWVPSAKAIMAGEREVYTTVHLVTAELDGGHILGISLPVQVQDYVLGLEDRAELFGEAPNLLGEGFKMEKLQRLIDDANISNEDAAKMFPIVGYAKECQEKLKVAGDWVVFPQVISWIAQGRYGKNQDGKVCFDGNPIPEGVRFGIDYGKVER
jgi:folate-dependent phosphoribosylglycinamide formyltransferase PurN